MPDERMESIRDGIAAPEESRIGRDGAKQTEEQIRKSGGELESAMGGTSDVDSPADESFTSAMRSGEDDDTLRLPRDRNNEE